MRPILTLTSFAPVNLCGFDTLIQLYANPPGGSFQNPAVTDSNQTLNPKFLLPGPHRIFYYATNGVCMDSASLNFNILAVPLVEAGPLDTLCQGGPAVSLSNFSPTGGVWEGLNVEPAGLFKPSKPGWNRVYYKIPAQAGFSCAGRDGKDIFVTPRPRVSLPADTSVCEGAPIQLNLLYGIRWKWQDGSEKPWFLAQEPGSYYVAFSDKFCTWQSDTFVIRRKIPLPSFSLGKDSNACFNNPVVLKGPPGMENYEWTFLDSNTVLGTDSTFELKDPAAITLTVKSPQGACYYTDHIRVEEVLCDEIFIPQAFSPNGDGENDVWRIYGISLAKLNLKVFNSWGECVFAANRLDETWDGTWRDKKCTAGAYQYIIEYQGETPRGRVFKERKAGVFYLIR
jgi:gliding motility-associated-like protein